MQSTGRSLARIQFVNVPSREAVTQLRCWFDQVGAFVGADAHAEDAYVDIGDDFAEVSAFDLTDEDVRRLFAISLDNQIRVVVRTGNPSLVTKCEGDGYIHWCDGPAGICGDYLASRGGLIPVLRVDQVARVLDDVSKGASGADAMRRVATDGLPTFLADLVRIDIECALAAVG